jgi:hypothetical protein
MFNFIRRFTTLERLQDTPETIETLQGFTKNQRQAIYDFLTARAYKLNKDSLRDSALWTRDDFMKITKTPKNVIPTDRDVKPKAPASFLPDVFKDDSVS